MIAKTQTRMATTTVNMKLKKYQSFFANFTPPTTTGKRYIG